MHDAFTGGIPLLAVLAGILFSRSDSRNLRADIRDGRNDTALLRAEMHAEFRTIHDDLRRFNGITRYLEGRVDELSKNR